MARLYKERALFHLAYIFSLKAGKIWCKLTMPLLNWKKFKLGETMKKPLLIIISIALFGCPATPKIIEVENGNERQLNCQQLAMEINSAEQAKLAAHAEDHFRAADIFPPTGAISVANIWRAGDHAVARLELLNRIANEKGCLNKPYGSLNQNIVLAQYIPQESAKLINASSSSASAGDAGHAKNVNPDNAKTPEDEEMAKDQDAAFYVKQGYDSEAFPHITPAVAAGH